jgi:hypothetical protein
MIERTDPVDAPENDDLSTRGKFGVGIFFLGVCVCADELAPGWGRLDLGWTQEQFYLFIAVVGAISGFLFAEKRPLLGIVPGALAGVGALAANVYQLTGTSSIHTAVLAIGAMVGALPGIILYCAVDAIFPAKE